MMKCFLYGLRGGVKAQTFIKPNREVNSYKNFLITLLTWTSSQKSWKFFLNP